MEADPGRFDFPEAVATDPDGNVYVADMKNSRLQRFPPDLSGIPAAVWSELGSDPGQVNYPRGIDVSPDGRIYVSDSDNHRIQAFVPISETTVNKAIIVAGGWWPTR